MQEEVRQNIQHRDKIRGARKKTTHEVAKIFIQEL
jgi:hypothetical protein